MYRNTVVPFYVAYPNYAMYSEEYKRMQDLEYLQEMYPKEVKKYRKKINQTLDRIDYEGSMIYDEFPDRITLYKLSSDITQNILRDIERENEAKTGDGTKEKADEKHIGWIVQILLFYEIHNRRYKGTDSFLNF